MHFSGILVLKIYCAKEFDAILSGICMSVKQEPRINDRLFFSPLTLVHSPVGQICFFFHTPIAKINS